MGMDKMRHVQIVMNYIWQFSSLLKVFTLFLTGVFYSFEKCEWRK